MDMYGHVFAASSGAGPRPAAASQAASTGRAEGPPQRRAPPHIALEYVAGFLKRSIKPREILPAAACVAILLWQLFLPGFIGLANNRDFAKVAGRLCIGRADVLSSYFDYFYADYTREAHYCWDSQIPTSELVLAGTASSIEKKIGDRLRFDIRWLGAIHAIVFMAAWLLLQRALRPLYGAAWWIAMAAAIWIFLDVGYISYLNTFYTDTSAILGAITMLAAAVWMLSEISLQTAPALWFTAGASLFLAAKPQHAALALVVTGFFVFACRRYPPPSSNHVNSEQVSSKHVGSKHVLTAICIVAMLAASAWVLLEIPNWYKAQARFTLVFSKILTASATPISDVRELGLSESDLPLIGQHAFLPYSPAFDPVWLEAFSRRCTYGRIASFFLRHPLRTLGALRGVLYDEAWRRRPVELSNFQPQAGMPPCALTARFGSWSALVAPISRDWPMSVVLWYVMVPVFGWRPALSEQSGLRRAVVRVALLAISLGLGEFLIASLSDARETDRHLLLFHLFTDSSIFLALVYFMAGARHSAQWPANDTLAPVRR
jgi:hypothetical protein